VAGKDIPWFAHELKADGTVQILIINRRLGRGLGAARVLLRQNVGDEVLVDVQVPDLFFSVNSLFGVPRFCTICKVAADSKVPREVGFEEGL